MKYLFDTNLWLERLLDQEKSEIVFHLLNKIPLEYVFISDFALHSIGVILTRLDKIDILEKFVNDIFHIGLIEQLNLEPIDFQNIIENINRFNLDFDDAYQITVAKKYNLILVTFDTDFNKQQIHKMSPDELLESLQ